MAVLMGVRFHRARGVVVLALALCGALGSSVPRAQAAPAEAAASPEVEALVQQGIELRRTGRDPEALAAFQAAVEREPSFRNKLHLAAAHQALGHWQEADSLLREALRADDDPYVRRHRATLERAAEFVGRRMGNLDVQGGPEGAEVRVNGKLQGTLPLAAPLRVPVGSYTLEVRLDGYYSVS